MSLALFSLLPASGGGHDRLITNALWILILECNPDAVDTDGVTMASVIFDRINLGPATANAQVQHATHTPVTLDITLVNGGVDATAELLWVSDAGDEQKYCDVHERATVKQETFAGHRWHP